ncbi:nuclear receptor-interacting protein 3-like [Tachypleus tridentatus]|uniref:nuclear receptor-interacting protein 3-like n=1 Tax=Tachypleus tridentatus TaxID=6853 RepID=UPI003FD66945
MDDEDSLDIRQRALRRRERRLYSCASIEQLLETETSSLRKRRSSSFDTQSFGADSVKNKTVLNAMAITLFEDESRLGRMHVPPIIKCECNGVESYALINTGAMISSISMKMVEKLSLTDEIIPDSTSTSITLGIPHPYIKGKVKYLDLTIGNWQQVSQFCVVEDVIPELTLGVDFLRKTQATVNFEDTFLRIGGHEGERVPFLTTREVIMLTRTSHDIRS